MLVCSVQFVSIPVFNPTSVDKPAMSTAAEAPEWAKMAAERRARRKREYSSSTQSLCEPYRNNGTNKHHRSSVVKHFKLLPQTWNCKFHQAWSGCYKALSIVSESTHLDEFERQLEAEESWALHIWCTRLTRYPCGPCLVHTTLRLCTQYPANAHGALPVNSSVDWYSQGLQMERYTRLCFLLY